MNHIIGILFVVTGAISIGLSGALKDKEKGLHSIGAVATAGSDHLGTHSLNPVLRDPRSPTWIAILWGIFTPLFFILQSFNTKRAVKKFGFQARTLSLGTTCTGSCVLLIIGVSWYWQAIEPFNRNLLLVGTLGSIIDSIAKALLQTAFSKGPIGSVAAISQLANVLLVIFDAIRIWKVPTGLEILGFFLVLIGALSFVLKEQVEGVVRAVWCAKKGT